MEVLVEPSWMSSRRVTGETMTILLVHLTKSYLVLGISFLESQCINESINKGQRTRLRPISFSTVRTCVGGFSTLTHRNKFLCASWVDGDNGIEIGFGGAHFHCYPKTLEDLIHSKANAMNTNNFIFFTRAD